MTVIFPKTFQGFKNQTKQYQHKYLKSDKSDSLEKWNKLNPGSHLILTRRCKNSNLKQRKKQIKHLNLEVPTKKHVESASFVDFTKPLTVFLCEQRKTNQSIRKAFLVLSNYKSLRKPRESIFTGWERKTWKSPKETDKRKK